MITNRTLEAYGLSSLEEYIDVLIGMVVEGKDIDKQLRKLSPKQRLDAMYYLGSSEAEEHLVIKNKIKEI